MEQARVIEINENVLGNNDREAQLLREELKTQRSFLLNLMSAPGSGKTTTVLRTIEALREEYKIGVIEADIDSTVDADQVLSAGIPALQLRTGGLCHLEAGMTRDGLGGLAGEELDLIILENVGNLVCPAEFDTGASKNAMILSVPEGDDKPLKYPKASKMPTFIIGKTLGEEMGSYHKAWIWGIMMLLPKSFQPKAARVGYKPGPLMGDQIFQDLIDHPEGRWVGEEEVSLEVQMAKIQHEDKKIHLFEPELDEWIQEITPELEDAALNGTEEYPLTLQAGRHIEAGMNGLMRNPYTHEARNPCALAIHPDDAKELGVADGQMVRVTSDAGTLDIETLYTYDARRGFMMIPHHFGFTFEGKTYGAGVNRLTNKLARDRIAGTPFHHNTKVRVEPIEGGSEA